MPNSHNPAKKLKFKRQWGAERRTEPLPMLHEVPSTRKIALSRLAVVLTVCFWLVFVIYTIIRQLMEGPQYFRFTMEAFDYLLIVTGLTFSALMYLIARQGAFLRFAHHTRVPRAKLDEYFAKTQPSITVLVPSYSEETQVIRKTLLSAALQEYPDIRVVLLIDDQPNPTNPATAAKLNASRALGQDIMDLLAEPYTRFSQALFAFERTYPKARHISGQAIQDLANHYAWAANWLNTMADNEPLEDHVDLFFADQVLRHLANDLELVSRALTASHRDGAKFHSTRLHQLYCRLVWIFSAQLEVFERKQYASLSHEANKAMNLNSYIGLMGGAYRTIQTASGTVLQPVAKHETANLVVRDSDYLLTLDADSILLREYCLRLVYLLEQPENAKVAVTQTPYSSFRGAGSRIERLAAATTDIQHILHQGMTFYDATFWVGANAVIRKKALEDIAETDFWNGFEVKRFIQDRTVIEDTESSIDLTLHGWRLVNYPERLSYSATPPDFGSLVVQRRRWANGGLLIMPKMFTHIKRRQAQNQIVERTEIMLRLNYMASIAWASFGLIFLLAYPYNGRLLSPFVLLAALPYFAAMASDLAYCGYNRTDIFRIYGFNLILLPVNLAGVLKSLQQALTNKKIPFARTPKVKNRTGVPMLYAITPLLIVAFSTFTLYRNILEQNWGNAAFAGFNAFAAIWAIVAYIGIGNTIVDTWLGLTNWLYIEKPPKHMELVNQEPALDWQAVLYTGEAKTNPAVVSQTVAKNMTNQQVLA